MAVIEYWSPIGTPFMHRLVMNLLSSTLSDLSPFKMSYFLYIYICNGFVIPVAQCFGAKKPSDLRKYVFNGYICSVVFSIVLTLASVIFCRRILIVMNTPADIIDHAYNYIVVIFIGIPTVFLYNMVSGVIRLATVRHL